MHLIGEIKIPGDKSISHRAIMLLSVGVGTGRIYHFLPSEDCLATVAIFQQLGVKIEFKDDYVEITGNGFYGLTPPKDVLNCFNSGTTARLLLGLLAGMPFPLTLIGDESLSKRPMARVVNPLQAFQAHYQLTGEDYLPATLIPSKLHAAILQLDVASAQVKSAMLLAALHCENRSTIKVPNSSRNHTELMLQDLGADIEIEGMNIHISGKYPLLAKDIIVPGDISSAAFFIVAALITENSEITIKNCGLNPTRTGILSILDQMNANYELLNITYFGQEKVGDIRISYSKYLSPFEITEAMIPSLIDEIPILTLLATQIDGVSYIYGAKELRIKESDRLKTTSMELNKLGANVIESNEGLIIYGKTPLLSTTVNSHKDHRISMMLKIARLICPNLKILASDCDKISYPTFEQDLENLLK